MFRLCAFVRINGSAEGRGVFAQPSRTRLVINLVCLFDFELNSPPGTIIGRRSNYLSHLTARPKICIVNIYILEVTMKATILDLRYRMNEVLKALDRNEQVSILYHGKLKGIITTGSEATGSKVSKHPFFNMRKDIQSVEQEMHKLRKGRYCDI